MTKQGGIGLATEVVLSAEGNGREMLEVTEDSEAKHLG